MDIAASPMAGLIVPENQPFATPCSMRLYPHRFQASHDFMANPALARRILLTLPRGERLT